MPETLIPVVSPSANLTVSLLPPEEIDDPRTGKRVVKKGVKVKFSGGRASLTPEEWDLMQQAPVYTGRGRRRLVWRTDELTENVGPEAVGIVTGAIGATDIRTDPAPLPDWDTEGVVKLAKRINDGQVSNLVEAQVYELQHKRRKTVLRALSEALLDGPDSGAALSREPEESEAPTVAIPENAEGF